MILPVRLAAAVMLVAWPGGSQVIEFESGGLHYQTLTLQDGTVLRAASARTVIDSLLQGASRNDVIKMVGAYELGLYGLSRFTSTNGYEQRRQSALAEVGSGKLKAAAAASAIAFVASKLGPGQSTDGAVFFPTAGRPIGPGRLVVTAGRDVFEFQPEAGPGYKTN
jgi:hypothetical protein